MHDLWIVGNKFLDDIQHELARLQRVCYLGKRHSGTLVIKYPLLCNVSLNIRVKQKALAAYAGLVIKHKQSLIWLKLGFGLIYILGGEAV